MRITPKSFTTVKFGSIITQAEALVMYAVARRTVHELQDGDIKAVKQLMNDAHNERL